MKLNLLPTSVASADRSKFAIVLGAVLAVLGIAAFVLMVGSANRTLAAAKSEAEQAKPGADAALARALEADAVIATVTDIDKNLKLAEAMIEHNYEYPTVYREVLAYIPTFFRVTALSAQPLGPDSAAVTLTGVLDSRQDYADMSLALLRIPGAISVTRAGFTGIDPFVPALTEIDQTGRMIEPGETNLPGDPLERIDALIARAQSAPSGFQNVGNFGSPNTVQRGAMPDWSAVTYVIVLQGEEFSIQTPDPRTTLETGAAAAPAAGAAPAGFPGGAATPPPTTDQEDERLGDE